MTNIQPQRLQKLFWELCSSDEKGLASYTLKREDHAGLPSLYRLYMEEADLVEYTFATKYLADWHHWERLCQSTWFKPYLEAWRKELAVKTKSEAVRAVQVEAKGKGKNSFQANKWLIDKGWVETKSKVGRPIKEEIKEHMSTQELNEHYERMIQ